MRSIEVVSFSSLESLVGTLEHRPQWRSHQKFQQILDCWPQIVGDVVAVQTRPMSIQRNVLSVSTSTPVWSQNLAFQRQHILKKLGTYVPDHQLKDIRFSPAKWLDIRKSSNKNMSVKRSLKRYHFDQSEARSLWSYHPCKLTESPRLASNNGATTSRRVKAQGTGRGNRRLPSPTSTSHSKPLQRETVHTSHTAKISPPEPALSPTPVQTFHDWAAKIQKRSQRLPKWPRCHSPTPIGELKRWSVCSLCVSQDW